MIRVTALFSAILAQPLLFVLLLAEAFAVVALGFEQLDEVRLAIPEAHTSERWQMAAKNEFERLQVVGAHFAVGSCSEVAKGKCS